MIHVINKNSTLIWQEPEEDSAPEEAVLITKYIGCFAITRRDQEILFNYTTIDELIKVLRQIKVNPGPDK